MKFTLQYSVDGSVWFSYMDGNGDSVVRRISLYAHRYYQERRSSWCYKALLVTQRTWHFPTLPRLVAAVRQSKSVKVSGLKVSSTGIYKQTNQPSVTSQHGGRHILFHFILDFSFDAKEF